MFSNFAKNTINPQLSSKTIPCGKQIPNLKSKFKNYFLKSWNLYEKLFQIIKDEQSCYKKPQTLRHPLIFYYGHTATFFINKFMDKGIIKNRINQKFQRMFAVGVDQNQWDDYDLNHYEWPQISAVRNYRQKVKNTILNVIQNTQQKIVTWKSDLWIILMCIDHQRLHLQTSAVIIRRLPIQDLRQPQWCKQCPFVQTDINLIPKNIFLTVPNVQIQFNKPIQKAQYYGWDLQFGYKKVKTNDFKASKMLVSNGQFFEFIQNGGYKKQNYWTEQGKKWLQSTKTQKPVFWIIQENKEGQKKYLLKTLTQLIQMPWNWPVEVNNLQARAFCNWKSIKQGKQIRLPTQDQYYALRNLLKADSEDWAQQSVGNINLQFWVSPCPVNLFQINHFCDIVGNVYQHTLTNLYVFQNFKIHPSYEDFTTPCLDSRHDIMKGGSFISTGNSASSGYRVGFRRHFYQFAGFRYVISNNSTERISNQLDQSDQFVTKSLKIHFCIKNSYIEQILKFIFSYPESLGQTSLVVGCSIGRLPLQLSKIFKKSYGIDYTARYFQMATKLIQKGYISYNKVQIELSKYSLNGEINQKVKIYQMNPLNVDEKKINNIDFMIIDGFNLKKDNLNNVVNECFKFFEKKGKCYLIIISDFSKNKQLDLWNIIKRSDIKKQNVQLIKNFPLKHQQKGQIIGKAFFLSLLN